MFLINIKNEPCSSEHCTHQFFLIFLNSNFEWSFFFFHQINFTTEMMYTRVCVCLGRIWWKKNTQYYMVVYLWEKVKIDPWIYSIGFMYIIYRYIYKCWISECHKEGELSLASFSHLEISSTSPTHTPFLYIYPILYIWIYWSSMRRELACKILAKRLALNYLWRHSSFFVPSFCRWFYLFFISFFFSLFHIFLSSSPFRTCQASYVWCICVCCMKKKK